MSLINPLVFIVVVVVCVFVALVWLPFGFIRLFFVSLEGALSL